MLKIFSPSVSTPIATFSCFRSFRFISLVFFSLLVVISCGDTTAASDGGYTGGNPGGEPTISCTDSLTPTSKDELKANIVALYAQCGGNSASYSNIDVSGVTDMSELFKGNTNFNGDITMWNTSNVTDMESIFHGATAFNQDLSSWDMSGVTSVNSMFENASNFNQNLSGWKLNAAAVVKDSTVPTKMFYFSGMLPGNLPGDNFYQYTPTTKAALETAINAEITKQGTTADLSIIDTSKVTDMSSLFKDKTTFNGYISTWVMSGVTTVTSMFENAIKFNQNLSGWKLNTAAVIKDSATATKMFYLSGMQPGNLPGNNFYQYSPTTKAELQTAITTEVGKQGNNADLSIIDTSQVTDMSELFRLNRTFNGYVATWDTSKVEDMTSMFNVANIFNQPIGGWDTSKVKSFKTMFSLASSFNQDLTSWSNAAVKLPENDLLGMFYESAMSDENKAPWMPPNTNN